MQRGRGSPGIDTENENRYQYGMDHPKRLADLDVGERGIIAGSESGDVGDRLREMGLTPGTPVALLRRGLGGCPLQLHLRGYRLLMRADDAKQVAIAGPNSSR